MGALTHNGEVLQSLPANASQINFDKTGTNLNSTQTENAIKEVNTKVNTNTDNITQLKSGLIKVVSGTRTFTDVAANTSENLTVYPQGLIVAHAVTCLDADGVMTNTSCGIKDITTNSVKIYARNNGSTAATIKVKWVAFGS